MYSIMKPDSSWFLETAGEVDGSGVSGFHNWFHWYQEEQKGKTTVHQPNILVVTGQTERNLAYTY
jgi:hypothetical protein